MPKAYGALTAGASNAADRLAAKNKPSGKQGDALLTTKVKQAYAKSDELANGVGYEDWLDANGYALGDNGLVYKK